MVKKKLVVSDDTKNIMSVKLEEAVRIGDMDRIKTILEMADILQLDSDDIPDWPGLLFSALELGLYDATLALLNFTASVDARSPTGWQLLHKAANDPKAFKVVEKLIGQGADVNAQIKSDSFADYRKKERGDTPLHRAAATGSVEIVKLLLEHGAEYDKPNGLFSTPLILAVDNCHLEIVKILLEKGADVHVSDIVDFGDRTALDSAVQQLFAVLGPDNTIEVVHHFSTYQPSDIRSAREIIPGKVDLPPARMASLRTLLSIIDILVDRGASGNILIQALTYQSPKHSVRTAKVLIEQGASLDVRDHRDLHIMQLVACIGDYDLMKLFLDEGGDFDFINHSGWTLLMISLARFRETDINVIRLLVENGADVNYSTSDTSALSLAVMSYPDSVGLEIIEYLLDQGCDVNAADANGNTALLNAFRFRRGITDYGLIRLLLDRGADVNVKNDEGKSPIFIATSFDKKNDLTAVQLLIDYGADLDMTDSSGNTPLMLSVFADSSEIAQLLIRNGASMTTKNQNGDTPLHLALIARSDEVITTILETHPCTEVLDLILEDNFIFKSFVYMSPDKKDKVLRAYHFKRSNAVRDGRKAVIHSYLDGHLPDDTRTRQSRGSLFIALQTILQSSSEEIVCMSQPASFCFLYTLLESRALVNLIKQKKNDGSAAQLLTCYRVPKLCYYGVDYTNYEIFKKKIQCEYEKEIREMNAYRLNASLTVYDLISKDMKALAGFARDPLLSKRMLTFRRRLSDPRVEHRYDIHKYVLLERIERAINRRKLMNVAQRCLGSMLRSEGHERRHFSQTGKSALQGSSATVSSSPSPISGEALDPLSRLNSSNCDVTTGRLVSPELPVLVTDKILSFLSDIHLSNLIAAYYHVDSPSILSMKTQWRQSFPTNSSEDSDKSNDEEIVF